MRRMSIKPCGLTVETMMQTRYLQLAWSDPLLQFNDNLVKMMLANLLMPHFLLQMVKVGLGQERCLDQMVHC